METINKLKDYKKDPKTKQKYTDLMASLISGIRK